MSPAAKRRRCPWPCQLPLAMFACITSVALAVAVHAEPVVVSNSPTFRQYGFRYSISMPPWPGDGYQPLTIDIQPLGATFTRERSLTFQFKPLSRGAAPETTTNFTVTIPQGATEYQARVNIPREYPWSTVEVRVSEQGRLLSRYNTRFSTNQVSLQPLDLPVIGIVLPARSFASKQPVGGIACPDVRSLQVAFDAALPNLTENLSNAMDDPRTVRLDHQAALRILNRPSSASVVFRTLEVDTLPTNWLSYSQLDAILLHASLLEMLKQDRDRYRALTDWLAAGGSLWVYGRDAVTALQPIAVAAPAVNALPDANQTKRLLNLSQTNNATEWDYNDYSGPIRENFRGRNDEVPRLQLFREMEKQQHPAVQCVPNGALQTRLRTGSFGLGRVVTISDEDPFPGTYQLWLAVREASGPGGAGDIDFNARYGMQLAGGSTRYWSAVIGSIGQPPVVSFVVLNTMFILLIGPIAYGYLRRSERLYLLYFAAPALALLVTAALAAYAVLDDGLGTKARTQQVTFVDPANGYTVTEGRQSYFAVLDSARGLQFPDTAALYPVRFIGIERAYYRSGGNVSEKRLSYRDGLQICTGAYLPPREQVQHLIVQPQPRTQTLAFDFEGKAKTITNHLPYALQEIRVRDRSGQLYRGQSIAPGEEAKLSPIDEIGRLCDLSGKPPPVGVQLLQSTRGWNRFATGNAATALESQAERWNAQLPPQSFIAIADQPEQAILGRPSATWTDQRHIVLGRLP